MNDQIYTIEATGKDTKVHSGIGFICILIAAVGAVLDPEWWPVYGLLLIIGIVWSGIARILTWWRHG